MTTAPTFGGGVEPAGARSADAGALAAVADLWWIWLVAGIAWCFAALVILQFDQASVTTVGVIIGIMFLFAGTQQLLAGSMAGGAKWLFWIFGVLFCIAVILALIRPVNTFAGIADMLGFLFLLFGIWWTMEAFLLRAAGSPVWWFGLISGPAMIVLAFWTSGQFFIHKAYLLLVFAGIWALMRGIGDIIRAFAVRSIGRVA